ncbi:hypothetical protein AB4Y90_18005 [Chryseobacterium sp. 2TAF14]|uniref:hypothetical protein n=1 Tax=Chryseobacterium sp. 2TAF14 TaxID=3233007 RepID=UPI003F9280A8
MKYLALLFLTFSCSKSIEDRCFTSPDDNRVKNLKNDDDLVIYDHNMQIEKYDATQILAEKPDYLQIVDLKKFRSFKKDSIEANSQDLMENKWEAHEAEFKVFNEAFSMQFSFSNQQKLGMWCMLWAGISLDFGCVKLKMKKLPHIFGD